MDIATHQKGPRSEIGDFDSVAWLLVGWTRTVAGRLTLRSGDLTFANSNEGVLFRMPVRGIESVWSPWYYFGGGLKFKQGGVTYRLAFVLPNDQPAAGGWRRVYGRAARQPEPSILAKVFPELVLGRMHTRRWLQLLAN